MLNEKRKTGEARGEKAWKMLKAQSATADKCKMKNGRRET